MNIDDEIKRALEQDSVSNDASEKTYGNRWLNIRSEVSNHKTIKKRVFFKIPVMRFKPIVFATFATFAIVCAMSLVVFMGVFTNQPKPLDTANKSNQYDNMHLPFFQQEIIWDNSNYLFSKICNGKDVDVKVGEINNGISMTKWDIYSIKDMPTKKGIALKMVLRVATANHEKETIFIEYRLKGGGRLAPVIFKHVYLFISENQRVSVFKTICLNPNPNHTHVLRLSQ